MALNHPQSGGSLVAEFQVAPAPWLTQSTVPASGVTGYTFPTVARYLKILNHNASDLQIGFTANGVQGANRFLVTSSGSLELDCRFTSVFIKGTSGASFSLFVGLTGVDQKHIAAVTGSNGYTVG
jgi:hypothetical protein